MNYTDILKRAGQITWRHRALWLFGVLLALFGGGGGSNGDGGSNAGQGVQYSIRYTDIEGLPPMPTVNWAVLAAVVLALLAFVLVLIAISVIVRYVSIGALIGMVDEVEREESTSISSGFRVGWARFLRLFAINLLFLPAAIILIGLLLIVLVPLPLIIVGARADAAILVVLGVIGMICLFLLWLLVVIVVAVVWHVLLQFVYRRCVLAREGVFDSLREGYHMLRRSIRDAGLTWLLLLGIRLLLNVVLVPLALLLLAVPLGMAAGAWALSRTLLGALVAGAPLLFIVMAALVFVEALWLIFESAVWTLVYRELTAPPELEPEAA